MPLCKNCGTDFRNFDLKNFYRIFEILQLNLVSAAACVICWRVSDHTAIEINRTACAIVEYYCVAHSEISYLMLCLKRVFHLRFDNDFSKSGLIFKTLTN